MREWDFIVSISSAKWFAFFENTPYKSSLIVCLLNYSRHSSTTRSWTNLTYWFETRNQVLYTLWYFLAVKSYSLGRIFLIYWWDDVWEIGVQMWWKIIESSCMHFWAPFLRKIITISNKKIILYETAKFLLSKEDLPKIICKLFGLNLKLLTN